MIYNEGADIHKQNYLAAFITGYLLCGGLIESIVKSISFLTVCPCVIIQKTRRFTALSVHVAMVTYLQCYHAHQSAPC